MSRPPSPGLPVPVPPSDATTADSAVCATCLKSSSELGVDLKPCSACGTVLYCSKKCRKAGREEHLEACMAIRPVKAASEGGSEVEPEATGDKVEGINKKKKKKTKKSGKSSLEPLTFQLNIEFKSTTSLPIDDLTSKIRDLELRQSERQSKRPSTSEGYDYATPLNEANKLSQYRAELNLAIAMSAKKSDPSKDPFNLLNPEYPPRTYLSSLPELEAMKHLIDAFRLRLEDEYTFNGDPIGLYAGEGNAAGWKEYLKLADKKEVLPANWDDRARQKLNELMRDEQGGHFLDHALTSDDLVRDYEDLFMIGKMRILAEKIYGKPVTQRWGDKDYSDEADFEYDSI